MTKHARISVSLLCLAAGLLIGGFAGWDLGSPAPVVVPAPLPQPMETGAPAQSPKPPSDTPEPQAALPGEIWGTVELSGGGGLVGVEVSAMPATAPPDAAETSLEAEVAAYAARLEREVRATTGPDGAYRLTGLDPALRYTLEARRDGYQIGVKAGAQESITHHAVGKAVDFVAATTGTVRLDLRLPDGGLPERAWVTLQPEGNRSRTLWDWSPAKRTRVLQPGVWQVAARAGRHDEYAAEPVELRVSQGGTAELTLTLAARPTIAGHVIVPRGLERLSATVELQRLGESGFERVNVDDGDENPRPARNWYVLPAFRFHGLEPGEYRVILHHASREVDRRDVTLSDAVAIVELALPEPDRAGYLIVQVSGPDGPMNRGVSFVMRYQRRGGSDSGSASALARGDGEYWVRRPADADEDTRHWLEVKADQLGTRAIELERDGASTFHVQFSAPAFVTLEIEGFYEHASRDSLLADCRPAGTAPRSYSMFHQPGVGERVRRLGPLEPGEYEVELLRVVMPDGRQVLQARTVLLHPGEQTVRIALPEFSGFVLVIPPEYRNQQIQVNGMDAPFSTRHQQRQNQGEEEIRFGGLTPGRYMVSTAVSGAMVVSLPADRDRRIVFEPKPFNAYLVFAMHAGQRLDFPAKPGDIVIEVEGVPIENMDQARGLIDQSRKRERSTWTVLRDGVRTEISFAFDDMGSAHLGMIPARAE